MRPLDWRFCACDRVIVPGQLNREFDGDSVNCPSVIRLGERRLFYCGKSSRGDFVCMAESSAEAPSDWRGLCAVVGPAPGDATRWERLADSRGYTDRRFMSRGHHGRDQPAGDLTRLRPRPLSALA